MSSIWTKKWSELTKEEKEFLNKRKRAWYEKNKVVLNRHRRSEYAKRPDLKERAHEYYLRHRKRYRTPEEVAARRERDKRYYYRNRERILEHQKVMRATGKWGPTGKHKKKKKNENNSDDSSGSRGT